MLRKEKDSSFTELVQVGERCVEFAPPPPEPPFRPTPKTIPRPPARLPPQPPAALVEIFEGFERDSFGRCWKVGYRWVNGQRVVLSRELIPCSGV